MNGQIPENFHFTHSQFRCCQVYFTYRLAAVFTRAIVYSTLRSDEFDLCKYLANNFCIHTHTQL